MLVRCEALAKVRSVVPEPEITVGSRPARREQERVIIPVRGKEVHRARVELEVGRIVV